MDRNKWQSFLRHHLEKLPNDSPLTINIPIYPGVDTTDSTVGEIKDILLESLFSVPSLNEALAEAHALIETLQDKIQTFVQGETLTFVPPKWEYKWITDYDEINELGAKGWEAVLIDTEENAKDILFKRHLL